MSSRTKHAVRSSRKSESARTIIAVDQMYEDMKSAVEQEYNKDKLIVEVKRA